MTSAPSPSAARWGPGKRAGRPGPAAGLSLLAVTISLFSLLPLWFVVQVTATTGWDTIRALVLRPRVGELLGNTVLLVGCSVPLCLVLGVGSAWLVERTTLRGARWWALALAAPLAIPAFVTSYAWVSVVPSLGGLSAGVLIAVLSYYPLVYIPVAATLSRLDPAIEESAAALGLGPWAVFGRVVLPQLRVSIAGGGLLVGLHLLSEYGAFAMIRFDTFTTAIMSQFQATFNGVAGNMLALVLVLLCLALLAFEGRVRGRARYSRIGSGSQAVPPRAPLGRYQLPAQVVVAALVTLGVAVPVTLVLRWVVRGGTSSWTDPELVGSLLQTLVYGAAGAAVTLVVAFPLAHLAVRRPSWFSRLLELSTYVTSSMPGIVVGLAFVTVTIRVTPSLYQTAAVLVAAYVLLFLPRALVSLRSGLVQAPAELEEAARSLGRRPATAFARVTLRLAAPSAAAGGALVFLAVVNELTATLLLAPNGTRTLATAFWSRSSAIDYTGAAPYALVLVVLSAPMTYVLFRQSRKAAGQ